MKHYLLLLLFLFSLLGSAFSQRILVLDLAGMRSKRIKYNSGEYIAIKVKNDKAIYKGYLEVVTDSSFYVNDNYVLLDSVRAVVRYNKAPKVISKQAFMVAGLTAIISGVNNGLTKGDVFPGDESYFIPLAFAGLGVALMPFWRKTHKIDGNKKIIKILDLSPYNPIE